MKQQTKADIMLLVVVLFWGISYLLIDISLVELETFTLNAFRFLIAFFVAVLVGFPHLKKVSKTTIKYAALLGFVLMIVYMGATYGVMYTSLSNAGFLCALTVVITPILAFIVKKEKPEKKLALAVSLAFVGIALLSLNKDLKPALGDVFCLFCAFGYSFHLLIIESAVHKERVNAFQLGVLQLGFAGLYQLIVAFIIETPHFPETPKVWGAALVLALFCTGLAFIVQTVAQQFTSATHVGVIFSLEPVFAAVAAFVFAGEVLSKRAYFGASILLLSLFIMEIHFEKIPWLHKKNQDPRI